MQPNQKLEIQIDRALFRKSYPEFFRAAWKEIDTDELVMSWYITYICNRLQDAIERVINGEKRIKHIAISLPPRTAKSSIVSKQHLVIVTGKLFRNNARSICISNFWFGCIHSRLKLPSLI